MTPRRHPLTRQHPSQLCLWQDYIAPRKTDFIKPLNAPAKEHQAALLLKSNSTRKKQKPSELCSLPKTDPLTTSPSEPLSLEQNSSTTPETREEESAAFALLPTQQEPYSLPIHAIKKKVEHIRDLIMKIPLTLKTHETQEAARCATQNYVEELDFLQRLSVTLKRNEAEHASANARPPATHPIQLVPLGKTV